MLIKEFLIITVVYENNFFFLKTKETQSYDL